MVSEKFATNVLKSLSIGEMQHVEHVRIYRTDINRFQLDQEKSLPLDEAVPALVKAVSQVRCMNCLNPHVRSTYEHRNRLGWTCKKVTA